MTVFTIYYRPSNGDIVSYLESGLLPPIEEAPKDTKRVCYDKVLQLVDDKARLLYRINPITLDLVPLDSPKILTENPLSAGDNPIIVVPDPNREIRHV